MKSTSNMDGTSRKSPLPNFVLKGKGVMKCAALEPTVSNIRYLSFPLRIALAMLIVVFVSGCVERLAQKHEYFAAANDVRAKVRLETERLVTYHQAVRHGVRQERPDGCHPRRPFRRTRSHSYAAPDSVGPERMGSSMRRPERPLSSPWRPVQWLPSLGGGPSPRVAGANRYGVVSRRRLVRPAIGTRSIPERGREDAPSVR